MDHMRTSKNIVLRQRQKRFLALFVHLFLLLMFGLDGFVSFQFSVKRGKVDPEHI